METSVVREVCGYCFATQQTVDDYEYSVQTKIMCTKMPRDLTKY